MSPIILRPGERFGKWTIVNRGENGFNQRRYWCKCDCGRLGLVYARALRIGASTKCKNCGCGGHNKTHGHTSGGWSPTYLVWMNMKQRCANPKNTDWPHYGGRGIKVCKRWMKFENFLADMGEKPRGLTIDRIDNDKGYGPSNCRWATKKQQCRNTRRNKYVIHDGKMKTIAQAAQDSGINYFWLHYRVVKSPRPIQGFKNV